MSAKDILVKPIDAKTANDAVKRIHYSGKVVPNSQLHLGVFYAGKLEGVMQFGPSINKKGTINLVEGTTWNGFIELNRMAFSEALPKNSESRAISIAMRYLKKYAPHIEWVISFADGTQCGDGTIYRASGFYLTAIRPNDALRENPETGEQMHVISAHHKKMSKEFRTWKSLVGFQLRYVYFLNPEAKQRLTAPVIPFSEIAKQGATMYRGKRPDSVITNTSSFHDETGGVNPTSGLQTMRVESDHSL
jgi:hypothetical protein